MTVAMNVLPFVSQRPGDDFVAGDHCLGPFKVHSVALSATPQAAAADQHILLLPLSWSMLGWALLPTFVYVRVHFCSTLTLAFPTLLPAVGL